MKWFLFTACWVLLGLHTFAQQNYAASLIPKELLPYASNVIRENEITTEVKDLNTTIYHVKTVITVLNKNGDDEAHIVIFHDKTNSIRYVKGAVYDEFGKQTSKFTESNFTDQAAINNFSLFEDERVKHFAPPATDYPYTVAYEYELRSEQTLNFMDWRPNSSTSTAVENSNYTFICKPNFNIRYKEINVPEKVTTATNATGSKTYTWKMSNIKAGRIEPFSPNPESYLTKVKISPEKFEYEGYKGEFTNWQELGKWYYDKLLTNRQYLPNETVEHIKTMTADITDPKIKAKKIYEYMQGKTHYISVQVGIGGYQPFYAKDVDNQNYGDCKALVNYMQALLKVVNIESYFCIVEAGDRKVSMLPDFASMNQANHAILCIPFKNDTTWLECTNQKIPFGFMGDFTDDRTVLACTPQGGKLMHTPIYTAQQNLQNRKATFSIDEAGALSGDITTVFKGIQYENHEYLIDEATVEQDKIIKKVYPINNLIVKKLEIKQDKTIQPTSTENIKLEARDYATREDGKIYFMLNPVNRDSFIPAAVRNRHNDVYINDGITDEDEIVYNLPAGYKSQKIPLHVSIEKPFGKYSASMVLKNNQLIYKRHFQLTDGTYNKDMYQDLVDFYQEISEADHYNVVLTKATN